jgi:hypothetical protein
MTRSADEGPMEGDEEDNIDEVVDEGTGDDASEEVESGGEESNGEEPDGGKTDGVLKGVRPSAHEDSGLDIMVSKGGPYVAGSEPTQRDRLEAGLQDTLDLSNWKMPVLRDYFWYFFVYGVLIALAIYVVWRYQTLFFYLLWGGYLVVLVVLAGLIVRSLNYRRGTYSKGFDLATLDVQQAIEEATNAQGLVISYVDNPKGAFLRPLIAVYKLRGRNWTVSVEGKPQLQRKIVRVGRFHSDEEQSDGMHLCTALDASALAVMERKRSRALFKD